MPTWAAGGAAAAAEVVSPPLAAAPAAAGGRCAGMRQGSSPQANSAREQVQPASRQAGMPARPQRTQQQLRCSSPWQQGRAASLCSPKARRAPQRARHAPAMGIEGGIAEEREIGSEEEGGQTGQQCDCHWSSMTRSREMLNP